MNRINCKKASQQKSSTRYAGVLDPKSWRTFSLNFCIWQGKQTANEEINWGYFKKTFTIIASFAADYHSSMTKDVNSHKLITQNTKIKDSGKSLVSQKYYYCFHFIPRSLGRKHPPSITFFGCIDSHLLCLMWTYSLCRSIYIWITTAVVIDLMNYLNRRFPLQRVLIKQDKN